MRLQRVNADIIENWSNFIKNLNINNLNIRPIILESWKLSKRFNIDPYIDDFKLKLNKKELIKRRDEFKLLLEVANPFMISLYNIVNDTEFLIRLTDKNGYVLEHIGNEHIINICKLCGLNDGYNVREDIIGTNAIGIALRKKEPIQVFGGEHYIKMYHDLTSSACPIKNKDGSILGVLSVSGKSEFVHPHTLGMVVAAAEAIEKEIKLKEQNRELKLTNERFHQITESISEGIIRIDNNMEIMSMNRFARKLLLFRENEILGKNISEILSDTSRKDVLDKIMDFKKVEEEAVAFNTKISKKKVCILSNNPIKSQISKNKEGSVISFREEKKIHNLVNKIVGANAKFTFEDILGESKAIKNSINIASISAKTNTTILLQGESGTGKEMFAQAIHNESDRSEFPFIFLNCGAIPRELVSSELFGYVEGAFTGAKRGGHPGKFELADRGTIFLDEIGDMPLDAQVSLLKVLEDRTIVRVGGYDVIPIDVRVIAATNKDLRKEVELGNFRSDLFYRINAMTIKTPSLRERKEDIRIFINYFAYKFCKINQKQLPEVSEEFYREMLNYTWPGNVRELQNVIQIVINMLQDKSVLTSESVPLYIKEKKQDNIKVNDEELLSLDEIERRAVIKTIDKAGGNIVVASKILGIGRSTMYRKMKKYNIDIN